MRVCEECGYSGEDHFFRPRTDRCCACDRRREEARVVKPHACSKCHAVITDKAPKKNGEGRILCTQCNADRRRKRQRKHRSSAHYRTLQKQRYWADRDYYLMKNRARTSGAAVETLELISDRDVVCQMCSATERLEYDHIYPVSEGGRGTEANLQLLCRSCNAFKSNHFLLPGGGMMRNRGGQTMSSTQ